MKVRIDADERHPVYGVREKYGHEVDATPEQIERWRAAEAAFDAAQEEMEALYDAAGAAAQAERDRIKAEEQAVAEAEREAERQRIAKRNAKYNAARARLAGAEVFDADGNPVGRVQSGTFGLTLDVALDTDEQRTNGDAG